MAPTGLKLDPMVTVLTVAGGIVVGLWIWGALQRWATPTVIRPYQPPPDSDR